MVRAEVAAATRLGPLRASGAASARHVAAIEEALRRIPTPVTLEEASALVSMFGSDDCFGLAWSLITIIETAPGWPGNLDLSGDNRWLRVLRLRLANASAT